MFRTRKAALRLLIGATLLSASAGEAALPRKASLGAFLEPGPGPGAGIVVKGVVPGLSAERLGLRASDLVIGAGGRPVADFGELTAYLRTLRAGDPLRLRVRRGDRELDLRGKALGKPFETYAGARVDYGAVPHAGGQLRDILVTPAGRADAPIVFLLQGFSCASIEPNDPADAYRELPRQLAARGIGFYRVEKLGLGDSVGPTDCAKVDYATELAGFRAAYRHLVERRGVRPDRIFMLGHSLGGMQAPMLAAETPPRGIAVFGTVVRNWADYHLNVARLQPFWMLGADPADTARMSETVRAAFDDFFFEKKTPAEVAARGADFATALREAIAWDGGDMAMGRHYKFLQDLGGLPLIDAWRDSRTNVLSLYGEADLVALTAEDHALLAEIVNHYRPGTGEFVEVAATDHNMARVGTLQDAKAAGAKGRMLEGKFNPEIVDILAGWIERSMARPAVNASR